MSEKRFKGIKCLGKEPNEIFIKDKEKDYYIRTEDEVVDLLNEQQATINKLRKILAEAEDTIEIRLAEHYLKEYENIKHHIIGDNDE